MISLMNKQECWVDVHPTQNVVIVDADDDAINLTRENAIAAARAILRHFGEEL